MNLRCDNTFVQDEGWYQAYNRYEDFLRRHENCKVLYLEPVSYTHLDVYKRQVKKQMNI